MDIPLKDVIQPGLKFIYKYDFGSTTELNMKCISERSGELKEIRILAKNDPPEYLCDKCGKLAKHICVNCLWKDEGLLCDSCLEKHDCGEERILPVVNSPRMGVCAYTGGTEDF